MADFQKAIGHTLRWEGGFVDHPDDPGGATNRGITIGVFKRYGPSLLSVNPTVENLKALTEAQAKVIYKAIFWDGIDGDKIKSQEVAAIYFDGVVNMGGPHGRGNGVKVMQRTLRAMGFNIDVDGIHGPQTLAAINVAHPVSLHNNYKAARAEYYKDLARRKPSMSVFLKGWLNRIYSFADLVEKKSTGLSA